MVYRHCYTTDLRNNQVTKMMECSRVSLSFLWRWLEETSIFRHDIWLAYLRLGQWCLICSVWRTVVEQVFRRTVWNPGIWEEGTPVSIALRDHRSMRRSLIGASHPKVQILARVYAQGRQLVCQQKKMKTEWCKWTTWGVKRRACSRVVAWQK